MTEVTRALAKLSQKRAEMAAVEGQLRMSLAIERLLPDAFEHGPCKLGGRSTVHAPHEGKITIRRGNEPGTWHFRLARRRVSAFHPTPKEAVRAALYRLEHEGDRLIQQVEQRRTE